MNTCDTCKHWNKVSGFSGTHEWCNDFGECSMLVVAADDNHAEQDRLALVPDYGESVLTGPKFGCCHWEAR